MIFKTEAKSGSGIGLQFPELKPNIKIIATVIIRKIFIFFIPLIVVSTLQFDLLLMVALSQRNK